MGASIDLQQWHDNSAIAGQATLSGSDSMTGCKEAPLLSTSGNSDATQLSAHHVSNHTQACSGTQVACGTVKLNHSSRHS